MIKRILAVFLMLSMCVYLFGCKNTQSEDKTSSETISAVDPIGDDTQTMPTETSSNTTDILYVSENTEAPSESEPSETQRTNQLSVPSSDQGDGIGDYLCDSITPFIYGALMFCAKVNDKILFVTADESHYYGNIYSISENELVAEKLSVEPGSYKATANGILCTKISAMINVFIDFYEYNAEFELVRHESVSETEAMPLKNYAINDVGTNLIFIKMGEDNNTVWYALISDGSCRQIESFSQCLSPQKEPNFNRRIKAVFAQSFVYAASCINENGDVGTALVFSDMNGNRLNTVFMKKDIICETFNGGVLVYDDSSVVLPSVPGSCMVFSENGSIQNEIRFVGENGESQNANISENGKYVYTECAVGDSFDRIIRVYNTKSGTLTAQTTITTKYGNRYVFVDENNARLVVIYYDFEKEEPICHTVLFGD